MDTKNKKPKKQLAEESFRLALADFGRGLLLAKNQIENKNLYFLAKEAGELVGISGKTEIKRGSQVLEMAYSVELDTRPKRLILDIKPLGACTTRTQTILLSESIATFGLRPYFLCECGKQASVLYMSPGQSAFKCRTCANIAYESTRINKQSLNGLLYAVHKLMKLADKRERIKRMYYAGRMTKNGESFMTDYQEWQVNIGSRKEALLEAYSLLQ